MWKHLSFDPARLDADFVHLVVEPLRSLASETIDADAIIRGLVLPGSVSDRVVAAYQQHLFGDATPQEEPKTDWARHAYRILDIVDNQVRSLRKRLLIDSYASGARKGTYWGIRTNVGDYGLADTLPCSLDRTTELAETPTRLKRMDDTLQERLINWGYAVCDAALRAHVDPSLRRADAFPYPAVGV